MSYRFVLLSDLEQSEAEIILAFRVMGIDLQRLPEMSYRFVLLSDLEQSETEIVLGVRVLQIGL